MGGRLDWPRGAAGLAGPRWHLWTEGQGAGPPGPRWTATAPWPGRRSSPWGRYGARAATSRARAGHAGRGEADARVGHDGERPGRAVYAAGRLGGGRGTPASSCTW